MTRREQNRENMAKKRALESPSESSNRREQNRANIVNKRALNVSSDDAIASFQSKAKMGPDFVCTCCHRMTYNQNVTLYNNSKYTKASNELLEQVFCPEYSYTSTDGKKLLCITCDIALSRGNMPV